MTREIVLLGIGALFILIGIAGSVIIKDGAVFIKSLWARVCLFTIGIVLLILGIIPPSPPPPADETIVRDCRNCITTPIQNGMVGNTTIVKGNYNTTNDDLWILIWPELGGNKGWPQSNDPLHGSPAYKSNGKWSVSCSFAGPPQSYEIALYVAPAHASEVLRDSLRVWAAAKSYPGFLINDLPGDLKEIDRIAVVKTH